MTESPSAGGAGENSGTILVRCAPHRGPRVLAPLMVEKRGEEIVLDAQVTNGCMIILDEAGASALCGLLGAWLA